MMEWVKYIRYWADFKGLVILSTPYIDLLTLNSVY